MTEINRFVIFSTVGVFLVTVTLAVDVGGHEIFMILFLDTAHFWR
jgi:hypothetical protein